MSRKKSNRQQVQSNKHKHPEQGTGRVVKEKFQEQRVRSIKPIQAKNANQKKYLFALDNYTITLGTGASGTGKTYVACANAGIKLLKGEIEKIILIRPYEQVGKSIGARPGDTVEKLRPLMQSMIEPLKEVLGESHFQYCLEHGKIVMEALEDVRGRSYKGGTVVIVDEAQSVDKQTIKTLVTRTGEDCRLVLCGDGTAWQVDIRGQSGLVWFSDLIKELRKFEVDYLDEYDEWELHNNIGIVEFTKEDVVRSGITRMLVKVFDEVE